MSNVADIDMLIDLTKESHSFWVKLINMNKFYDAVEEIVAHNMKPREINLHIKFPEGMRIFNLPVHFKFKEKEDKSMSCLCEPNEKHGALKDDAKEENHVKLINALSKLIVLENKIDKLLVKFKGEKEPTGEEVAVSFERDSSLTYVLKNAPDFILARIIRISATIDVIEKELLY